MGRRSESVTRIPGRNPVIEALARGRRRVLRIRLDRRARPDPRLERLLALAASRGVPVERVDRATLDHLARGAVHNGVVADAEPLPGWSIAALLRHRPPDGEGPLFLLADEVVHTHNLGALLRTGLGAGLDALVVPTRRGAGLTPEVVRVAMGAAEEVPLVREGLSSTLKQVQRAGMRVVGAVAGGRPYWEVDLTGPLALVVGGESKGLSPTLARRCDELAGIPLRGGLESLNVSVAAAILLFERVRQQAVARSAGVQAGA